MVPRLGELRGRGLGGDDRLEVRRERDGGLAVAGRDVERESAARRDGGQPFEERGRIVGPIPFIGLRLARKMVLEAGGAVTPGL